MIEVRTPVGTKLSIPETLAEDEAYFPADQLGHRMDEARAYYEAQGFVVLRGLIPTMLCTHARAVFDADVRRSRIPMLRQKNMLYERHKFDADGFLCNPIFNVQDLGSRALGGFRDAVLDIVTHNAIAASTAAFLRGDRTKVIQTMFFEGSAGTWAHQDSYYQDSATALGDCVAAWFALEDIDAGAGRFYVCPRSHRAISALHNAGDHNYATGHAAYQQSVLAAIRNHDLTFAAPFLGAGDVLLWNSLTAHGSFPANRAGVSRTSVTAHYLRQQDDMLQFQTRVRAQKTTLHNRMVVGMLHDQDRLQNRVIREVAFRFPKPYIAARRIALLAVLAKEGGFKFRSKHSRDGDICAGHGGQ